MKKTLLSLIVCILVGSLALVQGAMHESGEGQEMGDNGTSGAAQAVQTSMETQQQNMGEETQIQNQIQTQVQSGNYLTENGKQIQVQEQINNMIQLRSGSALAHTSMNVTQEQTQNGVKLRASLSNGRNAEVKIMPDTASEMALERLRLRVCSVENNCSIELKEVGQGEQTRAAYEVQTERHFKLLGMFQAKAQVKAQVDAESGEVIQVKKPWWAFLATEPEE